MTEIRLRVLIANERHKHLELLEAVVVEMGHTVVARETDVGKVAELTARVRPDVALVGLGYSAEHGLDLVSEIVRQSYCPVIGVLGKKDSAWVSRAAERGLFAYIVGDDREELQSAIDITLGRYAEQERLRGAFERRELEISLERAASRLRRRQALDVHESVIQALAVAKLASELGRPEESYEALVEGLGAAQGIVKRLLDELEEEGVSVGQLIRDAVGGPR